jgi:hypothetical protein
MDRRISPAEELLVVLAVYCEPVSIPNSLLIREFTGNFFISGAKMAKLNWI